MSYFIFSKKENIEGTIYRIAENQSDLNNIIINQPDYKIIEDSQSNFDAVRLRNKFPISWSGNSINYIDLSFAADKLAFQTQNDLKNYIYNICISSIDDFLTANPNHPSYSKWNNYKEQLLNLNILNFSYPFTKSLEQYFQDSGQTSLNTLQLP
jgi:hypothetical protein